jgi:hypothetical protein
MGEEWMPAPGHDSSKCREHGHHDHDCCATDDAQSCADGFETIGSHFACDAEHTYFLYSCVAPHLHAPSVDGHEAREVFRGLMETTERMADALHLGRDLGEWERFAWQRRRLDNRRRALFN